MDDRRMLDRFFDLLFRIIAIPKPEIRLEVIIGHNKYGCQYIIFGMEDMAVIPKHAVEDRLIVMANNSLSAVEISHHSILGIASAPFFHIN